MIEVSEKGTLIQIASYNTNLQGNLGLPQDLVDWLSPTLEVSNFLTRSPKAPDIVAVGFQELLPLHLGFTGLSRSVIRNRDALIRSQIEKYAPNKETYSLVAHEVYVGVALLVYAKDEGIGRRVCGVETSWTGCGPLWMGNKGAVGIRFRVTGENDTEEEAFTFVNAHLTAHSHNLKRRIADWNHIVRTLLFPPVQDGQGPSTIYSTSHLFFLGDLNFRLDIPNTHPLRLHDDFLSKLNSHLSTEDGRKEMIEFDQLTVQRKKGTIFQGLFEADPSQFKCTYKFKINTVDQYSAKRMPSWTDRILYATYTDSAASSSILPLLYTSIPSYTTSDHKPIVAMLLIPVRTLDHPHPPPTRIPLLQNAPKYQPDSRATLKRYIGKSIGRIVGVVWFVCVLLGLGNAAFGLTNMVMGIGALVWWRRRSTGQFGEGHV